MSIECVDPLTVITKIVFDNNGVTVSCNTLIFIEMALIGPDNGAVGWCIDLDAYWIRNVNAMMNSQVVTRPVRAIRVIFQAKIGVVGSNRAVKPIVIETMICEWYLQSWRVPVIHGRAVG